MILHGETLIEGACSAPVLRLREPLSFWGGVDPASGVISQPRHPQFGRCVAGTVLAIDRTIGSSTSSAILLELVYRGLAPAALVLGEPDAILTLGVVIAREMGYGSLPVIRCDMAGFPDAGTATVSPDGTVEVR